MLRSRRSPRQRSLLLVGLGVLGTVISIVRFGTPESWTQGVVLLGYALMVVFGVGGLLLRPSDRTADGESGGDDDTGEFATKP